MSDINDPLYTRKENTMYCVSCGNPLSQGLSYCNRCGTNLKERVEPRNNTAAITALATAITIVGLVGLAIMMGGTVVLKKEAGLPTVMVGFFMLFTFLIVGVTEVMLIRSISKLIDKDEVSHKYVPASQPLELRPPAATSFVEPVNSVTENTTRTLQYSRREQ